MALKRLALVAAVAGAVLLQATAASAGRHHVKLRLSVVPLQTAQLGRAGKSLALDYGSGSLSDQNGGIIIGSLNGQQIGPVNGYTLDYGDPYTGGTGVMEISSSVTEFKNQGAAKTWIGFARFEESFFNIFSSPVVPTTLKKLKPPPFGQRHFAYLITEAAPSLNPLVKLDEQVTYGRYILELTVTAGSASAAEYIAPHLMQVLHRRLYVMLAGGHPSWTHVTLPHEPRAGQAPGGPDLSTLILQPTDVGMSHAVNLIQAYDAEPPALSAFIMLLEPAGPYEVLEQQIGWWPTATEATYGETYGGGGPFGAIVEIGFGGTPTPVDLSAVGDGATGYLTTGDGFSAVLITLTNGQAGESIFAESKATLHASDVQSLAQAAADRLNAGLP